VTKQAPELGTWSQAAESVLAQASAQDAPASVLASAAARAEEVLDLGPDRDPSA